ncbi:hypothetical protein PCE1_001325 [Barthelona sp. PCE]
MKFWLTLLCLVAVVLATEEQMDDIFVEEKAQPIEPLAPLPFTEYTTPTPRKYYFFDAFDSTNSWTYTKSPEYRGRFTIDHAGESSGIPGDHFLIAREKHTRYAMYKQFDEPIVVTEDKALVVQFEFRMEDRVTCSGGYLKLLTGATGLESFDGSHPYSIMFGPDVCGGNNRLHFIFTTKNPFTGELVEHHKTAAVGVLLKPTTQLYTLIVKGNSYQILVDNELSAGGSIIDEFTPSPATCPDINDVKPDDYPAEVIMEPMPEDWSVEEDGDFEGSMIPNPDYPGPWTPRLIKVDRKIHIEHPIDAVSFEILVNDEGIMWNNLLITDDIDAARDFAEETFGVRKVYEDKWLEVERQRQQEIMEANQNNIPQAVSTPIYKNIPVMAVILVILLLVISLVRGNRMQNESISIEEDDTTGVDKVPSDEEETAETTEEEPKEELEEEEPEEKPLEEEIDAAVEEPTVEEPVVEEPVVEEPVVQEPVVEEPAVEEPVVEEPVVVEEPEPEPEVEQVQEAEEVEEVVVKTTRRRNNRRRRVS